MSESLTISKSRDLELYHESLEEFIKYFVYNRSYKMGCDIQYSRCGTELFELSTKDMSSSIIAEEFVKHDFNQNMVYLKVPYKILFGDERLDSLYIKQHFAGKMYRLIDIQDKINRTLDIFIAGKKIISDEVSIVLMEKYFIISVPSKYKYLDDTPVYIISRYYLKNIILHGRMEVYVNEYFLNAYDDDEYELAVYINGQISYLNEHYTRSHPKSYNTPIKIIDPNIVGTSSEKNVTFEIFYIRNFNYVNKPSFHNGYLEILRTGGFNAPLPSNNVFMFDNRYFTRLNITQIAGSIYKCLNIDPTNLKLFYFYDKEAYADASYRYYDHFQWYWDLFKPQIYDNIMDQSKLPNLIKKFYLYNDDISCADYEYQRQNEIDMATGKPTLTDIFDYYAYRTRCSIVYDAELIQTYYSMLYEKMKINLNKISNVEIPINSKRIFYRDTSDIMMNDIEKTKYFNCNCIRISYPNPKNHILLIYLNGLKFNGYKYMINVNGIEYIYLEAINIPETLCNIMIEELDTINTEEKIITNKPYVKNEFSFSTNCGDFHEEDLRYLSILKKVVNNGSERYEKISEEPKSIIINHTNETYDYIQINFENEILDTSSEYLIVNENFYDISRIRTVRRGIDGISLETNRMYKTKKTEIPNIKDYFRVYRNGKLLPRNAYEIISLPYSYHINILNSKKYNKLELFEVEYIPNREIELFYREDIGDLSVYDFINNKSDLGTLQKNGSQSPFPLLLKENVKIVSNGRFLNKPNTINSARCRIWTTQGFTIHYTHSKKNLSVLCSYNALLYKYMIDKINQYINTADIINKNYTEYINTTMIGGPLMDDEIDCRIPEDDSMKIKKMWYDLYMEFLKHNIIDSSVPMPEYIAFKYQALENDEGTRIDINMSDTNQLYWMPLDATINYDSNEFTKFENLYYELLKDVQNLEVLNSSEIPDELYNKYQELFDNNTLLIQLPDYYKYNGEE